MKNTDLNLNLPLNFNQLVDLVKQLPYREKIELTEVLERETKRLIESEKVLTHLASEKVLAKDWQLPEENEAWKDL
ncbi:MAG TPA: hypothetical protein VJ855_07115 [Marinilabiliaceae bacterium]|nr:hypothetical protein [Marinilabiliaceae bacterium]